MKEVKVYLEHKELCEILGCNEKTGFADLEIVYRPDAEMWCICGKSFDSEDELEYYLMEH